MGCLRMVGPVVVVVLGTAVDIEVIVDDGLIGPEGLLFGTDKLLLGTYKYGSILGPAFLSFGNFCCLGVAVISFCGVIFLDVAVVFLGVPFFINTCLSALIVGAAGAVVEVVVEFVKSEPLCPTFPPKLLAPLLSLLFQPLGGCCRGGGGEANLACTDEPKGSRPFTNHCEEPRN